jgi:hypothetical protein
MSRPSSFCIDNIGFESQVTEVSFGKKEVTVHGRQLSCGQEEDRHRFPAYWAESRVAKNAVKTGI